MHPPKFSSVAGRRNARPSLAALWLGGTGLLLLLYLIVFLIIPGDNLGMAFSDAVANVLPLSLLAAAVRAVLKSYVLPLSPLAQMAAHLGLAVVFVVTWYATLILLLGIFGTVASGRYVPVGFTVAGVTWQVFQGLILYALIAACCYAVRGGREAADVTFVAPTARMERYLTRAGDELRPVEVADIVSITGAQDYAEVLTVNGRRHLVRMSLAEFERRLHGMGFYRVHRSTIVNFAHLERAEPAGGGRYLAHMVVGAPVEISRTGAQLLRELVV